MKLAADFRLTAREALSGKWGVAVLAGFLAMILGAVTSNGLQVEFTYNTNGASVNFELANQQIFSSSGGFFPGFSSWFWGAAIYAVVFSIVLGVALFILGSIVTLGYAKFNLELLESSEKPKIETMFSYFPHWKNAFLTQLLRTVYIFLWTLLFIIPGIVASYSYAMTPYILSEDPTLSAGEALKKSKEMMDGNRWRLFCLHFSFIGWAILAGLTLGIGNLWLTPYKEAANAAFYRELSGGHPAPSGGIEAHAGAYTESVYESEAAAEAAPEPASEPASVPVEPEAEPAPEDDEGFDFDSDFESDFESDF